MKVKLFKRKQENPNQDAIEVLEQAERTINVASSGLVKRIHELNTCLKYEADSEEIEHYLDVINRLSVTLIECCEITRRTSVYI